MMQELKSICMACEIALAKRKSPSHRELALFLEGEMNEILSTAKSPNEAFNRLYLLFKQHSSKMSQSFLCKQLNLSSKGSLNLAMKNKRGVSRETARGIPSIFYFNEQQTERWWQLFETYRKAWREEKSGARQAFSSKEFENMMNLPDGAFSGEEPRHGRVMQSIDQ